MQAGSVIRHGGSEGQKRLRRRARLMKPSGEPPCLRRVKRLENTGKPAGHRSLFPVPECHNVNIVSVFHHNVGILP